MNRQEWWKENILPWKDGWPTLWDKLALCEEAEEKGWPDLKTDILDYFTDNRLKEMSALQIDLEAFK